MRSCMKSCLREMRHRRNGDLEMMLKARKKKKKNGED